MSGVQVATWSQAIQERVLKLREFCEARTVALYRPFWNEVMTDLIAKEVARICFPQVTPQGMHFEDVNKARISLDRIDLVVVPGVVFDTHCFRVGLGKGHYDRALALYKGVTVGLAYNFQIVTEMPHHAHDLKCCYVASELRWLHS